MEQYRNEKSRRRISAGKIMMSLGLVLMLGAAGLMGYNQWDDQRAGQESQTNAISLIQEIESQKLQIVEVPVAQKQEGNRGGDTLRIAKLDGTYYMGVLTIPKLNRVLPVQCECTPENLRNAPCRYSGDVGNGELVICAHNYRNHFGGLSGLTAGDSVVFTDLDGKQVFYEVREILTTQATDVEGMISSGYDLTLFTCNYGGQERITVRCVRSEAPKGGSAA